jgi:UDP-glucuronate 4-epimerase
MSNVLVTGATGFIGQHLVLRLSKAGYIVFGISKNGGNIAGHIIIPVDMTNAIALASYCEDKSFDAVFHLAASVPSSFNDNTAKESLLTNVTSTLNLLDIFKQKRWNVFIHASSTAVYGSPLIHEVITEDCPVSLNNFYSIGKYFAEVLCEQFRAAHDLCISSLRISAPYGPGQRKDTVITRFIKMALQSEDITIYGSGQRKQDFTYIDDVVEALILAYQKRACGIFNIASGVPVSMKELAETILKVIPASKSKIVYTGIPDQQEHYRPNFSIEKAKNELGYAPMFLITEGIKRYADMSISSII